KAMAAPFLDVLVVLAGELRATQALPGIRWAATSENRFVSVHALEVLANLQDTGGIPYVLTRVEDANPTIRRTAIDALQRITGAGFETAAQWRTWAKAHALADIPKAP
ncbi:MAG: HEAT repeat domain-containing protein, partial [Myxococcota bacterium]